MVQSYNLILLFSDMIVTYQSIHSQSLERLKIGHLMGRRYLICRQNAKTYWGENMLDTVVLVPDFSIVLQAKTRGPCLPGVPVRHGRWKSSYTLIIRNTEWFDNKEYVWLIKLDKMKYRYSTVQQDITFRLRIYEDLTENWPTILLKLMKYNTSEFLDANNNVL